MMPKLRPRQEIDFSDFRLRRRPLLSKSPLKCLSIQTFQIKHQNEAFRISCNVFSSNGPRGQRLGSILIRKEIPTIDYRFWYGRLDSSFKEWFFLSRIVLIWALKRHLVTRKNKFSIFVSKMTSRVSIRWC